MPYLQQHELTGTAYGNTGPEVVADATRQATQYFGHDRFKLWLEGAAAVDENLDVERTYYESDFTAREIR